MSETFKILMLEDSSSDAALIKNELKKAGIDFTYVVVDKREEFIQALQDFSPNLILSDHSLPQFNSLEALHICQDHKYADPFILVTGAVSEEFAVKIIKEGADDYILKDNLSRLPSAILSSVRVKNAERANKNSKIERDMAYLELKKGEERYRRIIDTAQEGIWTIDENNNTNFANKKMCEILGFTSAEMIGKSFFDFMGKEERLIAMAIIEGREAGDTESREFKFLGKDDREVWAKLAIKPIYDDDLKYSGTLAMVADITKRKLAEKSLRESEKRHRMFFEKSQGFLCTHDLNGNFLTVNQAGANSIMYEPEELIGTSLKRILTPTARRLFRTYLQAIRKEKSISGQMNVLTKDGEERTWLYSNYLYEDLSETYVIGSSQDITDRIKMEAERIKSQLLAEESERIKEMADEISLYSNKLKDSINYAKRLQEGIYLGKDVFKKVFENSFIINYPKEIVSGDFYWFNIKSNKIVLALADCTGHGVPGALLSTLGYTMLNNIVLNENLTSPDQILKRLWVDWRKTFVQLNKNASRFDGMEIAVCSIDYEKRIIEFSGMGGGLFFMRGEELTEFKGDDIGISSNYNSKINNNDVDFLTCHKIPFLESDSLYLFSDGYRDQFGGPANDKFAKKRFRDLIKSVSKLGMERQGVIIEKTFREWKGSNSQIDDVLVIGAQL